jgi:hypothetical protein
MMNQPQVPYWMMSPTPHSPQAAPATGQPMAAHSVAQNFGNDLNTLKNVQALSKMLNGGTAADAATTGAD